MIILFFPPKGEPGDSATPPRKKKKTVVEPSAKGKALLAKGEALLTPDKH